MNKLSVSLNPQSSILTPLAVSLALLCGLLACEREAGPSGVRVRPAAASAEAAPAPVPSAAERESDGRTGRAEGQKDLGVAEPLGEAGGLTRTTAESLLGAIKASGKKGTLVNAWASWCGPCRREVPMLQALAGNLKPQQIEVVLVTVDTPKDEAKALSFLRDNHITLKSYIVDGSIGDFKVGINPRWPGMLPASFLFDGQAELVHFWGGEAFEQEIVSVVDAFLAGRPIEAETRFGLAPGKVER
jgi:thiol-disulfide isomerase/thioredoxin